MFPIVTPFIADEWEAALREAGRWEEFQDVPDGMRRGFSLGLDDFRLDRTYIPPNHAKTPEHLEFIEKQYEEELRLGRLVGPFTREELEGKIGEPDMARIAVTRLTLGQASSEPRQ